MVKFATPRFYPTTRLPVGTEHMVRGRQVVVLHSLPGRAFVKTLDQGSNWTAWIKQSEIEDGW